MLNKCKNKKFVGLLFLVWVQLQTPALAKSQLRCEEVSTDLYSCIARSKLSGIDYHYTLDLAVGFCGITITGPDKETEIAFESVPCSDVLKRKEIAEFIEMQLSQPEENPSPIAPESVSSAESSTVQTSSQDGAE